MVEIKKKAKFRVVCKNLKSRVHKTITIYGDEKKISFEEFVKKLKEKIEEI